MSGAAVAIGADHGGLVRKQEVAEWLRGRGLTVLDVGTHTPERCDALDYALAVVAALRDGRASRGILICRSGQMMAMVANRFPHVRAALLRSEADARLAREHNDANVAALGADATAGPEAVALVQCFLGTDFLGGRYAERIARLATLGNTGA